MSGLLRGRAAPVLGRIASISRSSSSGSEVKKREDISKEIKEQEAIPEAVTHTGQVELTRSIVFSCATEKQFSKPLTTDQNEINRWQTRLCFFLRQYHTSVKPHQGEFRVPTGILE